jgi:transcriptional regulator GlxA family with amidase domain
LPSKTRFDPTEQDKVAGSPFHSEPVGRGKAWPPVLRRAIAFIDENAHADIGLHDIAAAVNVTPRALQYRFRRHLNMTPLEYLRHIRLHRAHRDLEAADPAVDTVNAIAGRWGFGHAGRFSMSYKRLFGTAPSTTLRNQPANQRRRGVRGGPNLAS